MGAPRFETYTDEAGAERWAFIAGNGRQMGDGGEGYASERNAERAIESFRQQVAKAKVVRRAGSSPVARSAWRRWLRL